MRLPSPLFVDDKEYSVTLPPTVILPIWLLSLSVTYKEPFGSTVILPGRSGSGISAGEFGMIGNSGSTGYIHAPFHQKTHLFNTQSAGYSERSIQ